MPAPTPATTYKEQLSKSFQQNRPAVDLTKRLILGIANPKELNRSLINETQFTNWVSAISNIRDVLKSEADRGIDRTKKVEFQTAQKREQQLAAEEAYRSLMTDLKDAIGETKAGLLKDIKSKKFPAYSRSLSQDFKLVPDYSARALGAVELQVASSIPLKHITGQALANYHAAGRTDLVSALIERSALARPEIKSDTWDGIERFAKGYYEKLGIAEDRQTLRKLSALEDLIVNPLSSSIDGNGGGVAFSGPQFEKAICEDNLLDN